MVLNREYQKYKWFFTSSGKLVVGGKSAEQNDKLLREVEKIGKEYYIMHTSHPGSPFCVIISDVKMVTKRDLDECAIFTGCFSRAWKQGKKKTEVHVFNSNQIEKKKGMKTGTWGVSGEVKDIKVELKLVLTKQKKVYRAIPEKSVRKKDILLKICPGKINKEKMLLKLAVALEDEKIDRNELLSALPAGGVKVCN